MSKDKGSWDERLNAIFDAAAAAGQTELTEVEINEALGHDENTTLDELWEMAVALTARVKQGSLEEVLRVTSEDGRVLHETNSILSIPKKIKDPETNEDVVPVPGENMSLIYQMK